MSTSKLLLMVILAVFSMVGILAQEEQVSEEQTQENQDLVPGAHTLGSCVNVLTGDPSTYTGSQALDVTADPTSHTVLKKTYPVPSAVKIRPNNRSEKNSHESTSVQEAENNYAATLGVEGTYGAFSGKLSSSFSQKTKQSLSTRIYSISTNISSCTMVISSDPAVLKNYLTEECATALNGTGSPEDLFNHYGTHVVTGVLLGGKTIAIYSSRTASKETETKLSVAAEASYKGVASSVSGSATYEQSNTLNSVQNDLDISWKVFGGDASSRQQLMDAPSPETFTAWATSVEENPSVACTTSTIPIWELCNEAERKKQIQDAFQRLVTIHHLRNLKLFKLEGEYSQYPQLSLQVPHHYKILSGGAQIEYNGSGVLLTYSYPSTNTTWIARGKDHTQASNGRLIISVIAVYDPFNLLEVSIENGQGTEGKYPIDTVQREGCLVGGGATATNGQLLVISCPKTLNEWRARSSEHAVHGHSITGIITSYAIMLKSRNGNINFSTNITMVQSSASQYPSVQATVPSEYILVGGGAEAEDQEGKSWQLLTASYPQFDGQNWSWNANAKEHVVGASNPLMAYAIGLKIED